MADNIILILPFMFGAVVGSFLNVCIHRIPLGISIVSPPSSCPACGSRVPFYLNVPIISYLVLRGRCSSCGERFSARYPLVEAVTGLFAALLFARFGLSAELFVYFAFVSSLVVITFIDLDHRIIPDVISLPGIVIGLAVSFLLPSPGYLNSIIGAVVGGGVLFTVAMGYYLLTGSEGMGGGDIKLLAMIGAFLGWKGVFVTILAGSFIGALVGIVLIVAQGRGGKFQIPFGPFLAAGAMLYLFYGSELIEMYVLMTFGEPF